jgi:threonine synthase
VASNFERLHFEYGGRGNLETAEAFETFARSGEFILPPAMRAAMGEVFEGVAVSEAATTAAMARAFKADGELVDPHTAVALAGAEAAAALPPGAPLVVLATAHPAKFPQSVAAATGVTPRPPRAAAALAGLAEHFDSLAADADAVKDYVRSWP